MSYYLSPLEHIVGFHFARPGSFEIHPQSDSVSATEYKLWSPLKDVWQADQQVQSTGNTDWKGALGSLTWIGPPSRYWLQVNDNNNLPIMGTSGTVYRDGEVFATSPNGDVLGAALNSIGSKQYLVVASWSEPDLIFYRIEYIKSEVTGLWETIGTWETLLTIDGSVSVNRPSTIVTFNSSGNECKFLSKDGDFVTFFGFDNLNTVTIGTGEATEVEVANLNIFDSIDSDVDSLTYARTVNIGIDNGCAAGVSNIDTDNCPTESTREHDWSQTHVKTRTDTRVTATVAKGIIAADYIGDDPVYATYERIESKSNSRVVTREESSTFLAVDTGCTGTEVITGSRSLTLDEQYSTDHMWGYRIDMGFFQFVTQERVITGGHSNSGDVDGSNAYNYTFSSTIVQTERQCRLHFLDLRHGVALYTEQIITKNLAVTQSGTISNAGPGGSGGAAAGVDSYTYPVSYEFNTILIDKNGQTLLDSSSIPDANLSQNIGVPENETGCPYSTPSGSTIRSTTIPIYNTALMPWVGRTYDILLQAFVTDGKQNQCVSLEIIRQTTFGGGPLDYTRLGTYHYSFTAADLDTLTGLTGTNRYYNPVTLISG